MGHSGSHPGLSPTLMCLKPVLSHLETESDTASRRLGSLEKQATSSPGQGAISEHRELPKEALPVLPLLALLLPPHHLSLPFSFQAPRWMGPMAPEPILSPLPIWSLPLTSCPLCPPKLCPRILPCWKWPYHLYQMVMTFFYWEPASL